MEQLDARQAGHTWSSQLSRAKKEKEKKQDKALEPKPELEVSPLLGSWIGLFC